MLNTTRHLLIFLLTATLLSTTAAASGWLAGTASTKITPEEKTWMAGYASRTEPARGTLQDIHAPGPGPAG